MNRQTKRAMAKQGADRPQQPDRAKRAPNPQVERTGPRQYFAEVKGEMKKVAWPPRQEIWQSTIVVVVGLVVMTALIFCFDWAAVHIVNYVFS
jgi:preprotein translocase subunit SecE